MPEPTDHRAEAEEWLTFATESDDLNAALIGIGHALLAGPAAQPERVLDVTSIDQAWMTGLAEAARKAKTEPDQP